MVGKWRPLKFEMDEKSSKGQLAPAFRMDLITHDVDQHSPALLIATTSDGGCGVKI
jgi:hypothetical protein